MAPQYRISEDYVCLEARGPAAGSFLDALLSQTVEPLPAATPVLAGWLDARGRVRALFRVIRENDRHLLVTARDGANETLQRLRMFVLRTAVTLARAEDVAVGTVVGADAAWLEDRGLPGAAAGGTAGTVGGITWIAVSPSVWHVLGTPAALAVLAAELPAADPAAAALAEIAVGLPLVTAAVADRFVAQMLNLDTLGAVAFDKGCYPGQEIVARVHNLSDVKRRLRRYAAPTSAATAVGVAVTNGRGETVGEAVRSASAAQGTELLAVVDDAAAAEALTCGGSPLTALPLPST